MAKTPQDGSTTAAALDAALVRMHGNPSLAIGSIEMAAYLDDLMTEIGNRRSKLLETARRELREREDLVSALGGNHKKKRGRPVGSRNKAKTDGATA